MVPRCHGDRESQKSTGSQILGGGEVAGHLGLPGPQVIDRMSVGGKSCIRAPRAVCSASAPQRRRCTNLSIRVCRSTSVAIAERWLLPIMRSRTQWTTFRTVRRHERPIVNAEHRLLKPRSASLLTLVRATVVVTGR